VGRVFAFVVSTLRRAPYWTSRPRSEQRLYEVDWLAARFLDFVEQELTPIGHTTAALGGGAIPTATNAGTHSSNRAAPEADESPLSRSSRERTDATGARGREEQQQCACTRVAHDQQPKPRRSCMSGSASDQLAA
jgi:hypothetical protein